MKDSSERIKKIEAIFEKQKDFSEQMKKIEAIFEKQKGAPPVEDIPKMSLMVNEMSFDGNKLLTSLSDAIFKTMQNFISLHILSPEAGFNQVDGTFALFKFNKDILLGIAKTKEFSELPIKYRQIFTQYAMGEAKQIIEDLLE